MRVPSRALWLVMACIETLGRCEAQRAEGAEAPIHVETSVRPLEGEDIGSDCHYSLTIPRGQARVSAVWVIFDRGHDVHDLYGDTEVLAFARRLGLALLLHGHCPGRLPSDHGDMDMVPSKGLGPALMRALRQLAAVTAHPELSSANLVLLGFSGAGPLSARLVALYPGRVIAAILSSPGHYPPDGVDTVDLPADAQEVPELIIAGGADNVSGTELPYEYFRRYRRRGSPWTFLLQNRSPHCCTANARPLMLAWLEAVIARRGPLTAGGALRTVERRDDWLGRIAPETAEIRDSFGRATFNTRTAWIGPAADAGGADEAARSWLPGPFVAELWASFTRQQRHPVLPLQ